jgi:hypothetical protein
MGATEGKAVNNWASFGIACATLAMSATQGWAKLFGLAQRFVQGHARRVATAGVGPPAGPTQAPGGSGTEGGTMDHKASVAGLLGSATGAAEALTDCGLDCDDTEVVADFINAIDQAHRMFVLAVEEHRALLLSQGVPREALNDQHHTVRLSMQSSPATTSLHLMWRLADILKRSAHPDVVEAAREVVAAHEQLAKERRLVPTRTPVDVAMAKLAASLPKAAIAAMVTKP